MAHAFTTEEPRRLKSERQFRGVEWAWLDRAIVPSPAAVAEEAARIREERQRELGSGDCYGSFSDLDPDALLPAAVLQRAVEDVQEYATALTSDTKPERLARKAQYALQAVGWLFVDQPPVGASRLSFEEVCTLAGCRDCPTFREKLKQMLPLQEIAPSLLALCS